MKYVLDNYCLLVHFLGQVLGPSYEIALYDLHSGKNSIIAIANNHISERKIGAPISDLALDIITTRYFQDNDYKVNYSGFATKKNKLLRTSSFFIKGRNKELIGMLCIYFDDSSYIELSQKLLELCHPNLFIATHTPPSPTTFLHLAEEQLPLTLTELIEETLSKILQDKSISFMQLTAKEKRRIMEVLRERGVFSIKGAVKEVAKALNTSEPTIYRYLKEMK